MKKTLFLAALTATFALNLSADNTWNEYLKDVHSFQKNRRKSDMSEDFDNIKKYSRELIVLDNGILAKYNEILDETELPKDSQFYIEQVFHGYSLLRCKGLDVSVLFYPKNENNKDYFIVGTVTKEDGEYDYDHVYPTFTSDDHNPSCALICHVIDGKIEKCLFYFYKKQKSWLTIPVGEHAAIKEELIKRICPYIKNINDSANWKSDFLKKPRH